MNFPAVKKDAKENDRKEIVNMKERQAADATDASEEKHELESAFQNAEKVFDFLNEKKY